MGKICKLIKTLKSANLTDEYINDIIQYTNNGNFDRYKFEKFCVDYIKHHTHEEHVNLLECHKKYYENKYAMTLDRLILRYGSKEGASRWKEYVDQQALTNTAEYKKEKYGWSEEEFKQYNLSRAVTESNLIKKHGFEEGTKMWNAYVERQKYAGCKLEYFQEKYGDDIGKKMYLELNGKKRTTLDNFVRKYGPIQGVIQFDAFIAKISNSKNTSGISQYFFDKIYFKLSVENKKGIFYSNRNFEYCFKQYHKCYFVDFFDRKTNKVIEFMGDYYHCNPKIYAADYFNARIKRNAKDVWASDAQRDNDLRTLFNCDILYIWESEINDNLDTAMKKCMNFLGYESTNN